MICKIGSVETVFDINKNSDVRLKFKGVDHEKFEELKFGHFFPKESKKVSELFDEHMVDVPKWYCKKIIKIGSLKNMCEIKYQAVFYVEGTKVCSSTNILLGDPHVRWVVKI